MKVPYERLLSFHYWMWKCWAEFCGLFPDCEIWTERLFLIFPKSYIAIRTHGDES